MLNKIVGEALEAEIEYLQTQKKRIEARISAIQTILSPDEGLFQPTLPGIPKPKVEAVASGNGSLAGKGLREAIRIVLSSYPSGVKAADLTNKLEQMGYRPGGKTSTRSLVYAEIYRLAKKGKILRKGKKVFLPSDKGGLPPNS